MDSQDSQRLSEKAVSGFANAALYDEHRPSYPSAAVTTLLNAAAVDGVKGARVVDLAAGTGKFTELLAARDEHFSLLAVEPHAEMRDQLAKKLLSNVTVSDGLSTAIPAPSESVDAVVTAQAFHWFANEESLREIHRVLKPGGVFGMIWNAEDYNTPLKHPISTSWAAKIRQHLFDLENITNDHVPRFRNDKWRDVFEQQISSAPLTAVLAPITGKAARDAMFGLPLGEERVEWCVRLGKEALWKRVRTLGHVAVLEGRALAETRKIFDDALSSADVERDEQGRIAVHGSTLVAWTSKIA